MSNKINTENSAELTNGWKPTINPWIQLASGAKFDLVDLESNKVTILDLAQHLAKLCRFGGACTEFYSVAQHSVLCAAYAPEHLKYQALMHDVHEAITGDMLSPIKQLLPDYQAFERRIEKSINKGFIRKLDKTVLAVMLYGIEEAAYQYSIKRKFDEPELDALGEAIMDILLHGILKT